MASYLKDDYFANGVNVETPQSYLPSDQSYRTDFGIGEENRIPVLSGDDNIFSELSIALKQDVAYQKATAFIAEFTKVFASNKTPDRTYSKFIQNENELPDVELDWVFQYFRVLFLFSSTNEDYYCITQFDDKTGKYESTTGPLKRENYRAVAEEVMRKVG